MRITMMSKNLLITSCHSIYFKWTAVNKNTCDFFIDYHYSPWFFKYHEENLNGNVEFPYFT